MTALADLDHAADYIAADSPDSADGFVQRIRTSVRRLELFPRLGRCRNSLALRLGN